jgi:hypothetical protein
MMHRIINAETLKKYYDSLVTLEKVRFLRLVRDDLDTYNMSRYEEL